MMGDILITHPGTGATVAVPDSAVPHYRQSGWMTIAERDELAEHHAAIAKQAAAAAKAARSEAPRSAAAKRAAGGGD